MRASAMLTLLVALTAAPASAQSNIYGGATAGAHAGSGSFLDSVGPYSAAGGLVGWTFARGWGFELHVDRGFGASAEREHLEIYGTSTIQDRVATGISALAVWRARRQKRVGVAVTMGLSTRSFQTHTLSIHKNDPNDPY